MLETLRSVFDPKLLRKLGLFVPTVAALLVVASWPTDVPSTAHGALRLIGAPGHGVVNDMVGWLRSPDRGVLVNALPLAIGLLFAIGGGLLPYGNGNASGLAWVLMVPAVVVGGRPTIIPVVAYALVTFGVLAACFALADRSCEEPGFGSTFSPRDLGWMAQRSLAYALFLIPFLPFVLLLGHAHRSVTWPDSKAALVRSEAARRERTEQLERLASPLASR